MSDVRPWVEGLVWGVRPWVESLFPSRYSEMPRIIRAPTQSYDVSSSHRRDRGRGRGGRGTINQYFASKHCPVCEQLTLEGICSKCKADPQRSMVTLSEHCRREEMTLSEINQVRGVTQSYTF